MDDKPWHRWIPGVLGKKQMAALCKAGCLQGASSKACGYSAIDLHLGSEAYRLTEGSVKPCGGKYLHSLKNQRLVEDLPSTDGTFVLEPRQTYLFKLKERLDPSLREASIYGQATARSSVGRVDVLARLIVDGMSGYEEFTPKSLDNGSGDMFLEVTPITFSVTVKPDISLSQLRFFYGQPKTSEISGPELWKSVFRGDGSRDGTLSVDLTETPVVTESAAAFATETAKPERPPIKLWEEEPKPNPRDFWRLVHSDKREPSRLRIEKGHFYILRSKERIALPKGIAVYCRAIDETIGEMRIPYAGFVHPFFGIPERPDGLEGTPLIFEVRGHDVDVSLGDGERMARLVFYRMSEDAEAEEGAGSPYDDQTLKLSNFFAEWS